MEHIAILESDNCIINKYIDLIRGNAKKACTSRNSTCRGFVSFFKKKIRGEGKGKKEGGGGGESNS